MKKSAIAIATVVAFASTGAAFAKTVTSTVRSVDKNGDSVTLSDGMKFTLPEGIEAETLKVGEKVIVTYELKGSKRTVSNIRHGR
ncbi:MAG: hypothetical protein BGN87_03270 [Rhizobiales bacterium 65-79]|nr:DUF1344 domain-containing protein [Hyphomicrobiales bacterium]OJU04809.1 MAG: hypothetical protein BGN87_03270 [Rhizobiales bacterium 65-79]